MGKNMNVIFVQDYLRSAVKVFMYEDTPSARQFYKSDDTVVTVKEGGNMVDDDVMFCRIPNVMLKQFADQLSEMGVKTDNDHKIAGTLEATKYHLEDMRKLAKVA